MDNPLVSVKHKIHEQIYLELKRRSAMRYVKRLLFFLAISVLVIGIAIPAGAEPKTKACGKVKHVEGRWIFHVAEEIWLDQDGYQLSDDTFVLGDGLAYATYTGDLEGYHMFMYSTYVYPDETMEVVASVRLHVTAFNGKDDEEVIHVRGKQTFDMFPNQNGTFDMPGSGRYMFPFNPKYCAPRVFLRYTGTHYPCPNPDGDCTEAYSEGTYSGVIVGSCK